MYNNIALLIGHLVGDYLFQNHDMAVNKAKPGLEGWMPCFIHCFVYSIFVTIFVIIGGWRFRFADGMAWAAFISMIISFITHWPIDRHSLASEWMKSIGQTTFEKCNDEKRKYFVAPVYIAVDNTIHLVLMWFLFSALGV